jgi:ABC-type transport system involved in multi-copper enzyme maturation permease subunit
LFIDKLEISGVHIFLSTISDTSFLFILSMFASYFIGNEFTNRTIDNEIRVGYSRFSVILSRWIVVPPFTTLIYLFYTATVTLFVGSINGFETEFPVYELFVRLILFILQVMAIQSFAVLIVFICKKASLGMLISISFSVVTCNILRNFFAEDSYIYTATSFYRITLNSKQLSPQETILSFASAIITVLIMYCITYISLQKAEVK